MNRISLIVAVMLLTVSTSSCDFFRMLAGRPTSKEIENRRVVMEAELEAARTESGAPEDIPEAQAGEFQDDSTAVGQKADTEADASVETLIRSDGVKLSGSRLISPSSRELLTGRFFIVTGAFGSPANAEAQAARAREHGYDAVLISYTNGLIAVGVSPCDDLKQAYESLLRLRKEDFCPADAWIFDKTLWR